MNTKAAIRKLYSQADIEQAQDLCADKFMILMPWHNHMRGPFGSEDEAFEWLRQVGWPRRNVKVFEVTHPQCSTTA